MAYFPNLSDGDILGQQCDDCRLADDDPCPILWVQLAYNFNQEGRLKEAINHLVNEKGVCQMKPLIDKIDL